MSLISQPNPSSVDGVYVIHSADAITTSGSQVVSGFGTKEISVIVNVAATPTGTTPTLQFTLQEVDPGDLATVFGSPVTTSVINSTGVYTAILRATTGGTVKVSWAVTGTNPAFSSVYSTVTSKIGSNANATGSITVDVSGGTSDTVSSGSVTANGQSVIASNLAGHGSIGVQVSGIWVGTLAFEGSVDGTNYVAIAARSPNVGTPVTTTTANNVWRITAGGFINVRLRSTAWTSGTAVVTFRESLSSVSSIMSEPIPTGANVIGAVTQSGAWATTQSGTWSSTNADVAGTGVALNAANAAALVVLAGRHGVSATVAAGTLAGTVVPEVSYDNGTTYVAAFFEDPATEAKSASVVFTNPNSLIMRTIVVGAGATHARVRVSSFTSGTALATLRATSVIAPALLETGPTGSAIPPVSMQVAGSDGTNLRTLRTGTDGTVRTDPTGTTAQPITDNAGSLTVDSPQLPSVLGQTTASGSLPVVLASDQSSVPVAIQGTPTVSVSNFPATQPVSATSLPLPTGAATAAKQPSLGTAGTPSTDVLTVQGSASMTAIKVDGSAATQPVSGSVSVSNFPATQPVSGSVSVSNFPATQPVSATSLPLPTGAATETTLATLLTGSAFTARVNTLGQKTSANSTPVVLSSDQSSIPVAATIQGTPTVSVSNFPATQPVSGTVTANVGTTNGLALDATLTGGTVRSKITDGTNNAAVKPASTAPTATDPALVVTISPNSTVSVTGTVTETNASIGSNNATSPTSSTLVGGSDGTNLQAARIFDVDSGAGAQYVLGAVLRKSASGGSVEAGTSSDPLRIDPTGITTQPVSVSSLPLPTGAATETTLATLLPSATFTARINTQGQKTMSASTPVVLASDQSSIPVAATIQGTPTVSVSNFPATQPVSGSVSVSNFPATQPVSGTVTANIGTTNGLALDATLTGGSQKSVVRGGAKGTTTAADVTSTAEGANNQALDVQIWHSGVAVNPTQIRALTSSDTVTIVPSGTQAVSGSVSVSNFPATQPVSVVSLPLPTGAATETTLATLLTTSVFQARINTLGQKTSANSTPVVLSSDQSSIPVAATIQGTPSVSVSNFPATQPVSATSLPLPTGAATAAKQPALGTAGTPSIDVLTVQGSASMTALKVDGSSVTQPVSGAVSVSNFPATQPVSGSISVSNFPATQPVSGTVTANIGTTNGLALDATLTGGTARTKITDGTTNASVKPASTAAVATDAALVVAISPNNVVQVSGTVTETNASIGSNGSAVPTSSTLLGGSDGTNLQGARVFDADTGVGTQYVLGAVLRKSASGGSVEVGTSSDPLRIDPTGTTTQPVSGTVSVGNFPATQPVSGSVSVSNFPATQAVSATSLPLPTGAATETTLASRLADATFTARVNTLGQKTSANSTPVVLASDQSSIPVAATIQGTPAVTVSSGTVTANIGTTNGLALDATLTGGTQKAIVRGGAKGSTTAADVTSTAEGLNNQALDVQIWHSGAAINPTAIRALTSSDTVTIVPSGTQTVSGSVSVSNFPATQPISASSLPLPTGAATAAKQPALGTAGTASSDVITIQGIASMTAIKVDGSAVTQPVSGTVSVSNFPATQPVSGTVTANIGTTNGLALDATLTGGTQRSKITDGTNNAAVKAASTAAVASDPALVVAISPNNPVAVTGTVTATNASTGSNNSAIPTSSTLVGGSDGSNLQAARVFDTDTGAGVQYVLGTTLRKSASGGSVEAGTASDPLRIDPTGTTTQPISAASLPLPTGAATETTLGTRLADATFTARINTLGQKTSANSTPVVLASDQSSIPVAATIQGTPTVSVSNFPATQPVSGTVTANIGTTNGLALDATLTGGSQKAVVRGGAKGTTTAADATSTAQGANNQALDVNIYSGGAVIDPRSIRALTSSDTVTIVPSGTQTVSGSVSVSNFPATQPVSATSLPLPTGAATESTLATLLTTSAFQARINTLGQKTMANSTPVVLASDQAAIPVTGSFSASTANDIVASGTIAANGSSVTTATLNGVTSLSGQISGIWSGTIQFEGSVDGTNFVSMVGRNTGIGSAISQSTTGGNGVFRFSISGLQSLRFRSSSWTSGTATITLRSSVGDGSTIQTEAILATLADTGNNYISIKPGLSSPTTGDPALVVAISPNSSVNVSNTDVTSSGTLNALNASVQVSTAGLNSVGFQLAAGTLIGTIVAETSFDGGTIWVPTYFDDPVTFSTTSSIVFASSNIATARSIVGVGGSGISRVRVSAFTSGTASIIMRASNVDDPCTLTAGAAGTSVPLVVTQVGGSDGTNIRALKVSSSGIPYVSLSSPTAAGLGFFGQVTPYGTLKVTTEGSELFVEPFDGAVVDTTNRWTATTVGTGSGSQASGLMTITTGTTASNAYALSSQNLFRAVGVGFQVFGASLQLEASALTNNHRFWGLATQPVSWAATTPIQDGAGFEQDPTGALNAVTYNGGTRTIVAVLPRPNDGISHRYVMYIRADMIHWYLDNLEYPIATVSFPAIGQQTLPIRFHSINGTSGPASAPTFKVIGVGMSETSHSGVQLSDGTYAWRKATVDATGMLIAGTSSSTPTSTSVAGNASSVQLLAANASRRGATLFNDSTAVMYVKLGTTASATSFTVRLLANAYYEVPFSYNGRIDGIWVSATGNCRLTELT
jgi:epidermal growth factor receptor substrate 15